MSFVGIKMLNILEDKLIKDLKDKYQSSVLFWELFIFHIFGGYVEMAVALIMGLDVERAELGHGLAVLGG